MTLDPTALAESKRIAAELRAETILSEWLADFPSDKTEVGFVAQTILPRLKRLTGERDAAVAEIERLNTEHRANGAIISAVNDAINRAGIHCAITFWEAIDRIAKERDEARSMLATMGLSRMIGLDDPVRPDIHARVVRQRDSARSEVTRLQAALAEMTKARDELAEIAESATFVIDNGLCVGCRSSIENVSVERIDELRKVGG